MPELDDGPPPEGTEFLWDTFCSLSDRRPPGGALLFQEVESFCRLMRRSLDPWEVAALMHVDRIYREVMSDGGGSRQTRN